jgi:hypothetical protein
VEVGEEGLHLVFGEAALEGGHFALAEEDLVADYGVRGGDAAGEFGAGEDGVDIRGWWFEGEVVFFVAVGAADLVEVLAFGLLGGEWGWGVTRGEG